MQEQEQERERERERFWIRHESLAVNEHLSSLNVQNVLQVVAKKEAQVLEIGDFEKWHKQVPAHERGVQCFY